MPTFSLSRRSFLGLTGGLAAAATLGLAGCSSEEGSNSGGAAKLLLPGDVPQGWQAVQDKVNARLQAELGFTIEPQFINWSSYGQQALLKFTAGETFDTALQALWLNMAQLQQSGALADLSGQIEKQPNLSTSIAPELIKANTWGGKIWGVPQVNSAARVHHYKIRQDLADKVGQPEIASYADYEVPLPGEGEGQRGDPVRGRVEHHQPDRGARSHCAVQRGVLGDPAHDRRRLLR